ncbi:MAG: glycosyltransferase, partial [Bacteroidales bacterium]
MSKQIDHKPYRIIISGGGTGGHIFPAISIANALKKKEPQCEILFVGASNKMEMEKVPAAGYKITGLPIAGLKRSLSLSNLKLPFTLLKSIRIANKIIREFKPDAAVGVGGYASAPLLRAAGNKAIPYLIQEQNSYAGITNRFLAKKARKICVAYENMEKFFPIEKILITGNPVREGIKPATKEKRDEAREFYNLTKEQKVILVVGGSLGARTLNNSIKKWVLENRESDTTIIWQCGKFYYNEIKKFNEQNPRSYIKYFEFIK